MSPAERRSLLVLVLLLGSACAKEADHPHGPGPAAATPTADTAMTALSALDRRAPIPLLPMMAHHQKESMRDHLLVVQEIVTALGTEDYAAVEKAAARIAYSEEEATMCTHLGAGAPGFTAQAIAFHKTVDAIITAAKAKDRAATLAALGNTMGACTGCHAVWKQEIVDEETWKAKTGQAHAPTHPGH